MNTIAEKFKPILMINPKEKYKLIAVYYKILNKGKLTCIQYWVEWDYSKTDFVSKLLGYGQNHNFDYEPIFVYLEKNTITKIVFDAAHYVKGTIKKEKLELKNNNPIIYVKKGSHRYLKKPQKNYIKIDYKLKKLEQKKIKEMNNNLSKLKPPMSISHIINNPWKFPKCSSKNIFVKLNSILKGDHTREVFYK